MTADPVAARREALRQQQLLRVLWRDVDSGVLQGQARPVGAHGLAAGVAAYRGNAAAVAERALAACYPTLAELIGEPSFAALARDFWRQHPPLRGDIAEWGDALPAFVAASPQLADEPSLGDVARLEWRVHGATRAADAPDAPPDLGPLAAADPQRARLLLAPGTALLASPWPVVAIWLAHRRAPTDAHRFDDVREAFATGRAETALVWRQGLVVCVVALGPAEAAFVQALLGGLALDAALDAAGPDFAFDQWLARAIGTRLLAGVQTQESP